VPSRWHPNRDLWLNAPANALRQLQNILQHLIEYTTNTNKMSIVQGYANCPQIQTDILNLWTEDGTVTPQEASVLQVLLSDINRAGVISRQINAGDRRLRQVEMTYQQRHLISDVENSGRVSCSPQSKQGELTTIYDIDPDKGSRFGFQIDMIELERKCRDDRYYISRELMRAMSVLRRAINDKTIVEMVANLGAISAAPGTTYLQTKTKNTTTGAILYDLVEDVAQNVLDNEVFANTTPVIIGGAEFTKYARAIQAACCGDNGVDVNTMLAQNPQVFINSKTVGTIAGNTARGIVMQPGSVQLLTYNEFRNGGDLAGLQTEDKVLGTIADPDPRFAGLFYDYYAEYKCVGTERYWDFQLALSHDTAYLPSDLFRAGDDLEGVNGVWGLEINN